ncbi:MAG TPA: hypothetical protein PLB50_01940 [Candidatus Saccharicenans sp.]|nr:hypothetical protein [Candidatus Saccharicenans sp.]HQO75426.1 hypothetical protein [Candidatus Saccharicenans sp.]HUM78801.1 hypothetical protein [Candidatus Saccharicenans sp.]
MKNRNKTLILLAGLLLLLAAGLSARTSGEKIKPDEQLLQEAKILIFDKKWEQAEQKLSELLSRYPQSPFYAQALFYKGKCLSEQKGKEFQAWQTFEEFLKRQDMPEGLVEEARIASLDLAFALYKSGQTSFAQILTDSLNDPSRVIRYYAAFKLSYLDDKKIARKAVPVLKKLMAEEKDQELVDRAKIALLRISPESFQEIKDDPVSGGHRLIKIRIYEKGKKAPSVSINLPLALADLALQAMSEEDKNRIKQQGYDLDRLLSDLAKSREKLVRIEGDGDLIEIWIE